MPPIHHVLLLAAAVAVALVAGCQRSDDGRKAGAGQDAAAVAFAKSEQAWRDQRRERLLAPTGWASLVGLHLSLWCTITKVLPMR